MYKLKIFKYKIEPTIFIIAALLILNPLFFTIKQHIFFPYKLLLIQIFSLITLLVYLTTEKLFSKNDKLPSTVLLIYILYTVIHAYFSNPNPLSNHYVIILIPSVVLFFLLINQKLENQDRKFLSLSIIISFILSIIPGILLQAKYRPHFLRLTLSWANANYLASFLLIVISFTIYRIIILNTEKHKNAKIQYFYYMLIFIETICLIWTQSRGAILALIVVSAIFIFYYLIKNKKLKKLIISLLIFFLLFAVLYIVITNYRPATIRFRERVYNSSYKYIKDNWLFGTGPSSFAKFYPKYRNPDYKLLHQEDIIPHAHNEFLEQITELGILGLLLFVTFITSVTLIGIKNITNSSKKSNKHFYIFSLYAFWLLIIHNLVSITLRIQPIFLYLFVLSGFIVNKGEEKLKKNKVIKYILILFVPLIIWQTFINIKTINGLSYFQESKDLFRKENKLNQSIQLAEKSFRKIGTNQELLYHLGYTNTIAKNYRAADHYFTKLLSISPYYPSANYWKGYINSRQGNWNKAISYYKKEIKLNQNPNLYFNLAISYSYIDKEKSLKYYWLYLNKVVEKLEKDIIQTKKSYINDERKNIKFAFKNLNNYINSNKQKREELSKIIRYLENYGL